MTPWLGFLFIHVFSFHAWAESPDSAAPKHRLLLLKAGTIDPSQTNSLSEENSFAALSVPVKQHYIVQFSDSVSYSAFVVYTTAEAILAIQQLDEVTWTGIWY